MQNMERTHSGQKAHYVGDKIEMMKNLKRKSKRKEIGKDKQVSFNDDKKGSSPFDQHPSK